MGQKELLYLSTPILYPSFVVHTIMDQSTMRTLLPTADKKPSFSILSTPIVVDKKFYQVHKKSQCLYKRA